MAVANGSFTAYFASTKLNLVASIFYMKQLLFFLWLQFALLTTSAQGIGIGTNTPDNAALLELQSSSKGLLIPRMTVFQRLSVTSPAEGLLVYDTETHSLWHYNSTTGYWEEHLKTNSPQANIWQSAGNANYLNNASDSRVVLVGGFIPFNVDNTMEIYGKANASGYGLFVKHAVGNTGTGIYSLMEGSGAAGRFTISNTTNSTTSLTASTTGTGNAGLFTISNTTSNSDALVASTNGNGGAAYFSTTKADNVGACLTAYTSGIGNAAVFFIQNAANNSSGILCSTLGAGAAGRFVNNSSTTGYAGLFEINVNTNSSSALYSTTIGTGNAATFSINNPISPASVIQSSTSGSGKTASFTGGSGIEINSISSGFTHQIVLNQQNGSYARMHFRNNNGPAWTIAGIRNAGAANDQLNFFNEQSNTDRFVLYGNGNATLSGTLTQLSDERLKTNIRPIGPALAKLGQLHAYTYNWRDANHGMEEQIGLLAQEVEAVYPQLVRTDEKGNKSVAYQNLVPVLLQAIQEQQAQIDALNRKIAHR